MMAGGDASWAIEYAALPYGGGSDLAILETSELAVMLVQDRPRSWLTEKFLGRFKIFVSTRLDSLTAILVDQKLQASLLPLGVAHVCVVRVGIGRDSLIFFSGYVQPVTGFGCADIGRALCATGAASLRCLGMDGNGHSPLWGPSSVASNQQGILVENLWAREDLLSLNSPDSPPTYIGDDDRRSWIDVSAVSVDLLERVAHWRVGEDAGLGSDHALITWELLVQIQGPQSRWKLNWMKVDWTQF